MFELTTTTMAKRVAMVKRSMRLVEQQYDCHHEASSSHHHQLYCHFDSMTKNCQLHYHLSMMMMMKEVEEEHEMVIMHDVTLVLVAHFVVVALSTNSSSLVADLKKNNETK